MTWYTPNEMNEKRYLRRAIFLEMIGGIHGLVGGMIRHLKSLRTTGDDSGYTHKLIEESDNERMHLYTFL